MAKLGLEHVHFLERRNIAKVDLAIFLPGSEINHIQQRPIATIENRHRSQIAHISAIEHLEERQVSP